MPSITLGDIQAAADRKYGPFIIEGIPGGDVTFVSPIRLPKERRKQLLDLQGEDGFDLENVDDEVIELIRVVAASKSDAERLIKAANGDLAVLLEMFTKYTEATSLGEASPSES